MPSHNEDMTVIPVFTRCVQAIRSNVLIERVSATDKEFHFQKWFKARLDEIGQNYESGGHNACPDFRMVASTDGYELKGLAYPGRDATFDSNSHDPSGFHNGMTIYYVFGRYPKVPDGNSYPVLDLVICHGSFLNADHEYIHAKKSVWGGGSYGDTFIRDRKRYFVPTPFRIVDGVAHQQTLILPDDAAPGRGFTAVGDLCRRETDELVVGYSFDLRTNEIRFRTIANPSAGREHLFRAWRLTESPRGPVSIRTTNTHPKE